MANRGVFVAGAAYLCSALWLAGCQINAEEPASVHGSLPGPPSGELKFAGTPNPKPFVRQAGNYFARTVFEADGPGRSHIEVRELLIPPQTKSTVAPLPGPAVYESLTEIVTAGASEAGQRLAAREMRSLEAGHELQIENPDSRPADIRLYLIRSR
jgi:hypothetical protein